MATNPHRFPQADSIDPPLDRLMLKAWLFILAVHAVVLVSTFALSADWPGQAVYAKLGAQWEYTVGTWWSGILLLVCGVAAACLACRAGSSARSAARGLALFAALAVFLAIDELGSLHEQHRLAAEALGTSSTVVLLGTGLICALIGGIAAVQLWRDREAFGTLWLTLPASFGFLALAAAGQEALEHGVAWFSAALPWRAVCEEGSEYVGVSVILWTLTSAHRRLRTTSRRFDASLTLAVRRVALGVFMATPVLIALRWSVPTDELTLFARGDFAATGTVLLACLAGAAAWLRGRHDPIHRRGWYTLAALFVLFSVECSVFLRETIAPGLVDDPRRIDVNLLWAVPVGIAIGATISTCRTRLHTGLAATLMLVSIATVGLYLTPISMLVTAVLAAVCTLLIVPPPRMLSAPPMIDNSHTQPAVPLTVADA
ncbi:MAG: hypothetical protein AAF916_05765 [Planctomycetota bacterium]